MRYGEVEEPEDVGEAEGVEDVEEVDEGVAVGEVDGVEEVEEADGGRGDREGRGSRGGERREMM